MGYKKKFDITEISKGKVLKRISDGSDEYFEVGDYHPSVKGWELRPNGRNTYNWDGILLYVRPESISGRFELLDDMD